MKIRKQLAQRDPDNIEWQRGLWSSYTVIGEVYRQKGKLKKAKFNNDKALSIQHLLNKKCQLSPAN